MARDEQIDIVIRIFTHRFITSGVPLADFQEATDGIERWEDWLPRWVARAEIHETFGHEALKAGNGLTASEHFTTAGLLYHFGKFMAVDFPDQMKAAHMKAVQCRTLALPHLQPPGERVEIPYQHKWLAANLRRPLGIEKPPLVMMIPGLEATKEEVVRYEDALLARGMASLSIDGPGQGEGEYDFPIGGNYEIVAGTIIDWLESRNDVDTDRIGIYGVSLGGYHAPRAACFEKRIKACVTVSGAYDWGANWDKKSHLNREVFRIRSHSASMEEAKEKAQTISLKGIAKNISCPIYIVAGGLDQLTAVEAAEQIAADVSGPKVLSIVEDGVHVCHNRPYKFRPQTSDWMAQQLGAAG